MKSININQIKELKDINLIDVREDYEFQQKNIKGAVNLPLSNLEANYQSKLDKSKTYHIMCLSGQRSQQASNFLEANGYDVVNLEGGLMGYFE